MFILKVGSSLEASYMTLDNSNMRLLDKRLISLDRNMKDFHYRRISLENQPIIQFECCLLGNLLLLLFTAAICILRHHRCVGFWLTQCIMREA